MDRPSIQASARRCAFLCGVFLCVPSSFEMLMVMGGGTYNRTTVYSHRMNLHGEDESHTSKKEIASKRPTKEKRLGLARQLRKYIVRHGNAELAGLPDWPGLISPGHSHSVDLQD